MTPQRCCRWAQRVPVPSLQLGGARFAILRFWEARNEKGPMSSRNRSYTIEQKGNLPALSQSVKKAISNNAITYLNPPIKNLCYKGIKKAATEIKKWFRNSKDVKTEFQTCATLMERAGTGGALFRNLYRDFLKEKKRAQKFKMATQLQRVV